MSPLSGDFSIGSVGLPSQRPSECTSTSTNWVGPDYFKTLGTPLVAGRVFTEQDDGVNKVAIVNEKLASHYWPQENPIGKHLIIGGRDNSECEVVGW